MIYYNRAQELFEVAGPNQGSMGFSEVAESNDIIVDLFYGAYPYMLDLQGTFIGQIFNLDLIYADIIFTVTKTEIGIYTDDDSGPTLQNTVNIGEWTEPVEAFVEAIQIAKQYT